MRGGDGLEHLVYELVISNDSAFPPRAVTVRDVIVKADGTAVETIAGKQLQELMAPFGAPVPDKRRTTIQPGGTAKVLMDVAYFPGSHLGRRLDHELVVTPGPKGSIELNRFPTAPTTVGTKPAMVVAPPLRGPGWVVINGCCDEYTSHRSGLFSIDGTLHAGERYAIDFVQMTPQGQITDGPGNVLTSYPYYGDEVHSATAGKVVRVRENLADGPIDFELPPREAGDAGGNEIVVRVKPGVYAYYAHLIPGSARVKVGDRVAAGQTLASLGNTGNSNAPHLHFQLMDGPTPLGSEGLPYTFSSFTAEGRLEQPPPLLRARQARAGERLAARPEAGAAAAEPPGGRLSPSMTGWAHEPLPSTPRGAPRVRLGDLLRLQSDGRTETPQGRHRPRRGHQSDRGALRLRRDPPRHRLPLPPPPRRRRAVRPRGQLARRAPQLDPTERNHCAATRRYHLRRNPADRLRDVPVRGLDLDPLHDHLRPLPQPRHVGLAEGASGSSC